MRQVTVKRDELLAIVMKNREQHRAIFLDALDGYRKKVVEELERALAEAKRGERFRTAIRLVQPIDQTREYDRVIRMLELTPDETIVLQQQEFDAYVLDQWHWRQQFVANSMNYATHTKAVLDTMTMPGIGDAED